MSYYLRGKSNKLPEFLNPLVIEIANKANTLNALIQQAPPSPVELTLFRAVDVPRTGPPAFPFDEESPFIEFLKLGFLSTSYMKQDAIDFFLERIMSLAACASCDARSTQNVYS